MSRYDRRFEFRSRTRGYLHPMGFEFFTRESWNNSIKKHKFDFDMNSAHTNFNSKQRKCEKKQNVFFFHFLQLRLIVGSPKQVGERWNFPVSTKRVSFCWNVLIIPLTNLISEWLNIEEFLTLLKVAEIILIHQKWGDSDLGNHYRISVLTTLSKIFETVFKDRLVTYFETKKSVWISF